jgi:hypothetical protein
MQQQLLIQILILLAVGSILIYKLQFYSSPLSSFLKTNHCSKSLHESDNFICESDELWNERKVLYHIQDKLNMQKPSSSPFFLSNWEPNFHCSHARRIGKMGDGGKWVCDLFRLQNHSDCLVYSAGSHGDFSFESHMKRSLPNCEVHTFDSKLYTCPKDVCVFHQITLGNGTFPRGSKSWPMMVKELGHQNRLVDVFKIDIEGGEYGFFPSVFNISKTPCPRQILVEVHPQAAQTIHGFFELLRANNYVIFNKEPNILAGPKFFEYTFLKLNSRFFQQN